MSALKFVPHGDQLTPRSSSVLSKPQSSEKPHKLASLISQGQSWIRTRPWLAPRIEVAASLCSAYQPGDWLVPDRQLASLVKHLCPGYDQIYVPSEWHPPVDAPRSSEVSGPQGINVRHILHGVGMAWAMRYEQRTSAVMITLQSSDIFDTDLHQAINFAGVRHAPVVFLTSAEPTPSTSWAHVARAYGIRFERPNTQNLTTIYDALQNALTLVRHGEGPVILDTA